MKTLAVIGANYLQRPLVTKAKEMGLRTICFAWEDGAVCKNICDNFYPISIVEKEKILQICQEEKVDGVCTIASDVAAPTVAYVAEKMGLTGNDYNSAVKANNKYLMRNCLVKADVPCPKFLSIKDAFNKTIRDIYDTFNLPLIVKPTDRSGSLGVRRVDRWGDLNDALKLAINVSFRKEAIVEEFIEGKEISVEYISYKGKHYPLQITDKVTTEAPHFVELEHHQPSALPHNMYEKIYNINNHALTALGLTNGASHSEYKITQDGRVYVIEIGGRMGGDFIGSDLVLLSTGYDFVKGVIEVALGKFTPPIVNGFQSIKHSGVFFLCEQTKRLKPIIENIVTHSGRHPEIVEADMQNQELREVTCSADRSGYLIYQSDKKLDL